MVESVNTYIQSNHAVICPNGCLQHTLDLDRFVIYAQGIRASNETISVTIGRYQLEDVAFDGFTINCKPIEPNTQRLSVEETSELSGNRILRCVGLLSGAAYQVRVDMFKSGWPTRIIYQNSHWTGRQFKNVKAIHDCRAFISANTE